MKTKKSKFGLFILFSLLLMSLIGGVFGEGKKVEECPKFNGDLFTYMKNSNSISCLIDNMNILNWIIYIGLIFLVGTVLSNLFGNSRSSKFGAYLLAFMSITGFILVLLKNNILPNYLIFWAGEILVIAFVIILIKFGFKLSSNSQKGFNSYLKWIGLFLGLLILVQYNAMVAYVAKENPDMMFKDGNSNDFKNSTLGKIVGITGFLSFLGSSSTMTVLLALLILFLIGGTNVAREKVRGPLGNFIKTLGKVTAIEAKREKLIQELGNLYKTLRSNLETTNSTIKQTYKPETKNDINNLIILKLEKIIEINKTEDLILHNKEDQNGICEELIEICKKDNGSSLTFNEEARRHFLIQELFKLGKVYNMRYKQLEEQITNIINLIDEIKRNRFKNKNVNESVNFDDVINQQIKDSENRNFDIYIRNLKVLNEALEKLVEKVNNSTKIFDKDKDKDFLKNFFEYLNKELPATGVINPNDIENIVNKYFSPTTITYHI